MKKEFYSNGKLLLTSEYVVLDGAIALAIPTHYGQTLTVTPLDRAGLHWQSFDEKNSLWFETEFKIEDGLLKHDLQDKTTTILAKILQQAKKMNPVFLSNKKGWLVKTQLNFPRNWGLGTSSTLINNIAQWAEVDPFTLLNTSFGGSGYDIAAAQHNSPITYQLQNGKPRVTPVKLPWTFTDRLFFVYLNRKQDSKEGIARYKNASSIKKQRDAISDITKKILNCEVLFEFETLLQKHEMLISNILKRATIKKQLFSDYPNTIKSLGAWGGDFILAIGTKKDQDYFTEKGYTTIIPFEDMLL